MDLDLDFRNIETCYFGNEVKFAFISDIGLNGLRIKTVTSEKLKEICNDFLQSLKRGESDWKLDYDGKSYDYLAVAIFAGNAELLELLLQGGANANALRGQHCPILQYAYDRNVPELFELLLKYGADPDSEVLLKARAVPILHLICEDENANVEFVKSLHRHGADINFPCRCSPVMIASYFNNPAVVQYLCEVGADLNCVDIVGNGALVHSLLTPQVDSDYTCARVLLNYGCKPFTIYKLLHNSSKHRVNMDSVKMLKFLRRYKFRRCLPKLRAVGAFLKMYRQDVKYRPGNSGFRAAHESFFKIKSINL